MDDKPQLRTPKGNRTSVGWTLYELATAEMTVTRWEIMRRRSLRVGVKAIGKHLRELQRAGYVIVDHTDVEHLSETTAINTHYYRITEAGLGAHRG